MNGPSYGFLELGPSLTPVQQPHLWGWPLQVSGLLEPFG